MAFGEEQLNGRIARLIRKQTDDLGWHVQEESKGQIKGDKLKKPDIVIRRGFYPPVVIENEYRPGRTLSDDCLSRIGRTLEPDPHGRSGEVSVVFALRAPDALKECAHGDDAEAMLIEGAELEFAVYRGSQDDHSRFPREGFLRGDIRDFVNFIKPASIPEDIVNEAADTLTHGTNEAAAILMHHSDKRFNFGVKLGEQLHQPWPLNDYTTTGKQAKADAESRLQTAKMCATMLINAIAYQQNLSNHHAEIDDLTSVRNLYGGRELTKGILMDEWRKILDINYWPIFHIALELLNDIPVDAVAEMLPGMLLTADEIQVAMRQNDIAGIVFQRLIADRRTLKTYYTRPESTVFVAHLGVHDDVDWSDPDVVKDYRISDYACGTGGLVLAAYQRVRDLHRAHGGRPDELHSHMMEESLTACDIMPAAVHLSSSLLSSVAPGEAYRGTRNIWFPYGGVRGKDGELERDGNGTPLVHLGALDLLDLDTEKHQVVLPLDARTALGAHGERHPVEVVMAPASQDLVIMNPPFTRHTGEGSRFAAFGTTEEEQVAMSQREADLTDKTIIDWNAGLATAFAAIANNMVRPGGRIAMILPLSAAVGGSYRGKLPNSWQKFRELLGMQYKDIIVVSISASGPPGFAFSAETHMGEVVMMGTRLREGESPNMTAHFVNLRRRPDHDLEAQEVAREVRFMIPRLTEPDAQADIRIGSELVGSVSLENIDPHSKWTAVRIANGGMYRRIKQLTQGWLDLPYMVNPNQMPMRRIGDIAAVGPHHRRFREAFDLSDDCQPNTEYQFLWHRDAPTQFAMLLDPDKSGELRKGAKIRAKGLDNWTRYASNLHIGVDMAFSTNTTATAYTTSATGGGSSWPNMKMESLDYEQATCAWFNSTLGLMYYWFYSNRTQKARGRTTITAIRNMRMLDWYALPPSCVASAVSIFNDLCQERLLPASEVYRDPVRQEIDRRILTEVLLLNDQAVDAFTILRNQWCAEPTVGGGAKTSIQYNT